MNNIPAAESPTSTAMPRVYRGPSSLGKRYPEPMLRIGQSRVSTRKDEVRVTYATAWARATARGTATARRDSLPALLADQVTIKGVQTVFDGQ